WAENYQVITPDARYVLVMLSGYDCGLCNGASEQTKELNALSKMYSQSGLYLNDCSAKPLWTMSYISWRNDIDLAPDGHGLIDWGQWKVLTGTYAEDAVTLYEDGRLVKRYAVSDLVAFPAILPHSVSHYTWRASYSI